MSTNVLSFAVSLFIAAAPAAHAAMIDALTLTPSGTNTIFTIVGTYPMYEPTTPYSSPNTPYSLTFVLPTAPSSLSFVDTVNGIFGIDSAVKLNGVTFPTSQIAFFVSGLGGGLDVCLNEGCSPDPPTAFDRWVIVDDQLFSGSVSNPVFVSGATNIDPSQSFIEAPVPEPNTLTVAGLGFGAAMLIHYRKRKRSRSVAHVAP